MKLLLYHSLTFLIFVSLHLQAQKLLTLKECQKIAISNNLQIQQISFQGEGRLSNLQSAKKNFLPQVQASLGQNLYSGRSINPFTNQFEIRGIYATSGSLSVSWSILNGEYYNLLKSRLEYQNIAFEMKIKEQEIKQKVLQYFLELLLAKEDRNLSIQVFTQSKQKYLQELEKYAMNSSSKTQLLQIQNTYLQDSIQIILKNNKIEMAKNNLLREMNMNQQEDIDIAFNQEENLDFEDTKSLRDSLRHYSLVLQRNKIQVAQIDVLSNKRKFFPSISIGAGVNTSYSSAAPKQLFRPDNTFSVREIEVGYLADDPSKKVLKTDFVSNGTFIENGFLNQINFNRGFYVGASMQIPIFQKGMLINQLTQSKMRLKNEYSSLRLQEKEISNTIDKAENDMKQAKINYELLKAQLEIAKQNAEIAKQQYEIGKINFIEYQQMNSAYQQAEQKTIQAKIEFLFKKESLKILTFND